MPPDSLAGSLQIVLDWSRDRTPLAACGLSLAVNLAVFAATVAVGEGLAWGFRGRPVVRDRPPVSRAEGWLAAACVVLNAVVMVAGWWLFRAGIVRVVAGEGWGRWLLDAAALLLVMDLAMYLTHRMAHTEPFFRLIHGIHHRYDQPRPLTLFVLHPLEVLGFGGLWVAVLALHPFSLGGMLLYLTFNTLFGVVGHLGVEPCPDNWVRWPLLSAVGTSTFHARHHQHPTSNYGFYTALWDRLFRTLDPTYLPTFARPPAREAPPPPAR